MNYIDLVQTIEYEGNGDFHSLKPHEDKWLPGILNGVMASRSSLEKLPRVHTMLQIRYFHVLLIFSFYCVIVALLELRNDRKL